MQSVVHSGQLSATFKELSHVEIVAGRHKLSTSTAAGHAQTVAARIMDRTATLQMVSASTIAAGLFAQGKMFAVWHATKAGGNSIHIYAIRTVSVGVSLVEWLLRGTGLVVSSALTPGASCMHQSAWSHRPRLFIGRFLPRQPPPTHDVKDSRHVVGALMEQGNMRLAASFANKVAGNRMDRSVII